MCLEEREGRLHLLHRRREWGSQRIMEEKVYDLELPAEGVVFVHDHFAGRARAVAVSGETREESLLDQPPACAGGIAMYCVRKSRKPLPIRCLLTTNFVIC